MCAAGPSEHLAILALTHKEEILERNIGIAAENIALFDSILKRLRRQALLGEAEGRLYGICLAQRAGDDNAGACAGPH